MNGSSLIIEASKFSFMCASLELLTTIEVPLCKAQLRINCAGDTLRSFAID